MEETSPAAPVGAAAGGATPTGGHAPRDLREWIARAEALGQIRRIREEVSRDEEIGAPALLFEHITGSPKGHRALWNPIGSSVNRFALAIGEAAKWRRLGFAGEPPTLWALEDGPRTP